MSPEQEIERGFQADKWLETPLYQEAVESVRNAILQSWAASPIRDKEGQHELRLMLKALDDVVGYVKETAQTGKLARIQYEQDNGIKQRIKELAGIR